MAENGAVGRGRANSLDNIKATLGGTSTEYLLGRMKRERGRLKDACDRFGIAYQTAKHAAHVSAAFERFLRRNDLPWHHHKEVANHAQAAELRQWGG